MGKDIEMGSPGKGDQPEEMEMGVVGQPSRTVSDRSVKSVRSGKSNKQKKKEVPWGMIIGGSIGVVILTVLAIWRRGRYLQSTQRIGGESGPMLQLWRDDAEFKKVENFVRGIGTKGTGTDLTTRLPVFQADYFNEFRKMEKPETEPETGFRAISPLTMYPNQLMLAHIKGDKTLAKKMWGDSIENGGVLDMDKMKALGKYEFATIEGMKQSNMNFASNIFFNPESARAEQFAGLEYIKAERFAGNDPKEWTTQVNQWVSQHTDKKIDKMLPDETLKSDTIYALVSALDFQGNWPTRFNTARQMDFRPQVGDPKPAYFMAFDERKPKGEQPHFHYTEAAGSKYLVKNFDSKADDDFKFFAVWALPPTTEAFTDQWVKKLYESVIPDMKLGEGSLKTEPVDFQLPTLKLDTGLVDLTDVTKKFLAPDGTGPIFTHRHQVKITVNEKGAKVAAADAEDCVKSAPEPQEKPEKKFKADRPFYFGIAVVPNKATRPDRNYNRLQWLVSSWITDVLKQPEPIP